MHLYEESSRWYDPSIIGNVSATRLLSRCMVKYCKLLIQNSSWWWIITCLKHFDVKLSEMNYLGNCASSWSLSRMCITMHDSEKVKKRRTIVCIAGWYVSRCYCRHALHFAVPGSYIFIFSVFSLFFAFVLFSQPCFLFLYFLHIIHRFWFCRPFCCDSCKRLVDPLNSLFSCWPPGARWERKSIVLFLLLENLLTH